MTSSFTNYGEEYPMGFPPKSVNGGWFTGEPFVKNAPYGTVEVIPDSGYMTHFNLASARPPIDALFQYPGGNRPGNNFQTMPGVQINRTYQVMTNISPCAPSHEVNCSCPKCKFSKFAYF